MEDKNIDEIINYFEKSNKEYRDILIYKREPQDKIMKFKSDASISALIFSVYGSAKFTLNGKPYIIKPGLVLHSGSDVDVEIEAVGKKPYCSLILQYGVSKDGKIKHNLSNENFMIEIGENAKITYKINQIFQSEANILSEDTVKIKHLFDELINEIVKTLKNNEKGIVNKISSENIKILKEAVYYIQINYDKKLSVGEIAGKFGMERRKFGHLFKMYTGLNPVVYIREFKINRAKYLLRFSEDTITDIAYSLGYKDYSYFSRAFKETTHMLPRQFRNKAREEN